MKTPEEIKKGLEACLELECSRCPFFFGKEHCTHEMARDALAYINQLEQRLAQSERERDAAVTLIGKLIVILKKYPNAATNMCAYDAYKEIKKYLLDMRGVCEENSP